MEIPIKLFLLRKMVREGIVVDLRAQMALQSCPTLKQDLTLNSDQRSRGCRQASVGYSWVAMD